MSARSECPPRRGERSAQTRDGYLTCAGDGLNGAAELSAPPTRRAGQDAFGAFILHKKVEDATQERQFAVSPSDLHRPQCKMQLHPALRAWRKRKRDNRWQERECEFRGSFHGRPRRWQEGVEENARSSAHPMRTHPMSHIALDSLGDSSSPSACLPNCRR